MLNKIFSIFKKTNLEPADSQELHAGFDKEKGFSDNSIRLIAPYFFEGTWVFDDESVNLVREPFVIGVPEMIDEIVKDIADAQTGFRLLFSTTAFPGYQAKLLWLRAETGGNWYKMEGSNKEGWLCPALFKYYKDAPKAIFLKAEPRQRN